MAESPMFDTSLISDVEQYLGEQRKLHQLARDIAKRSIKLAQLMRQMDNMMFSPSDPFYFSREDDRLSLSLDNFLPGPGTGQVTFWHFFRPNPRVLRELGVMTTNQISLSHLTDVTLHNTLQKEALRREENSYTASGMEDIETNIFVDAQGNFAKVTGVPLWLRAEHDEINLCGYPYATMRVYKTPMSPRDLVLAKTVVYTLTAAAKKHLARHGIK